MTVEYCGFYRESSFFGANFHILGPNPMRTH